MASLDHISWKTKSGEIRSACRVSYYVGGRRRFKQFSGSTPAAAERKARKFVTGIDNITEKELKAQKEGRSPKIEQLGLEWIAACRRGRDGNPPLEPATIEWYEGLLRNWIVPMLGDRRIQALTIDDVKAFRDTLVETDAISRRTSKKVLATLKTLVGYAIEEGYLAADVTSKVRIRMSRRERAVVPIHSKAEMTAIFQAADRLRAGSRGTIVEKAWQRYWPLLHILVYAGLRLSEVRGIERDAVDTVSGTIQVRQRADKRGVIGAPKSAQGHRRIHVPDDTAEAIRNWLRTHNHPLVFATSTGRPIDGKNIRKWLWDFVQKEAGVRMLTLHAARHFFASREIEGGTNLKELCYLMGHSDEAFTLRTYGHLFRDKETESKRRAAANARVLA